MTIFRFLKNFRCLENFQIFENLLTWHLTLETLVKLLTIENNTINNILCDLWIKSDGDSIRNSCDVFFTRMSFSSAIRQCNGFQFPLLDILRCWRVMAELQPHLRGTRIAHLTINPKYSIQSFCTPSAHKSGFEFQKESHEQLLCLLQV